MVDLTDSGLVERFVAKLNEHADFAIATRWFDGSILLQADAAQLWLKIYNGKVIDWMPFAPPIGYTFKIGGPQWAWDQLVSGERHYADLVTPGCRHFADDPELATLGQMTSDLVVEGNTMEAVRLTEAQYTMAGCLIEAAGQPVR
jgi:hypothetical protein